MECGFTWGHLKDWAFWRVSFHTTLEPSLVDVGSLNSLLPWRQPHRALLRDQLLLKTELLSCMHPFVPSSVSFAQAPAHPLLAGLCGWVAWLVPVQLPAPQYRIPRTLIKDDAGHLKNLSGIAYVLRGAFSLSISVHTCSPPCCLSQVQIREFCLITTSSNSVWEFSCCEK